MITYFSARFNPLIRKSGKMGWGVFGVGVRCQGREGASCGLFCGISSPNEKCAENGRHRGHAGKRLMRLPCRSA